MKVWMLFVEDPWDEYYEQKLVGVYYSLNNARNEWNRVREIQKNHMHHILEYEIDTPVNVGENLSSAMFDIGVKVE